MSHGLGPLCSALFYPQYWGLRNEAIFQEVYRRFSGAKLCFYRNYTNEAIFNPKMIPYRLFMLYKMIPNRIIL